jgi:hypothetical protein
MLKARMTARDSHPASCTIPSYCQCILYKWEPVTYGRMTILAAVGVTQKVSIPPTIGDEDVKDISLNVLRS